MCIILYFIDIGNYKDKLTDSTPADCDNTHAFKFLTNSNCLRLTKYKIIELQLL